MNAFNHRSEETNTVHPSINFLFKNNTLSGITNLDCFIGIHDDGNEETQYHIDEEGNEGVEVDAGEPPHHRILARSGGEGGKHVVSIDEGVQALHRGREGAELWYKHC